MASQANEGTSGSKDAKQKNTINYKEIFLKVLQRGGEIQDARSPGQLSFVWWHLNLWVLSMELG